MGQKQMSVGVDARVHGMVQFAAKDRKVRRVWPWKQKEIVAIAIGEWIARRAKAHVDVDELAEALPQRPDELDEVGGEPLVFDLELFERGTGTLSFKLAKAVERAFERACHATGSKKGKAVEKAVRRWLERNGYEVPLAAVGLARE